MKKGAKHHLSGRRIDPKPLTGEREFAVAPVVRDFQLGHSPAEVRGRLDRLCADLSLDRDRALG